MHDNEVFTAVIIDDEALARSIIEKYLETESNIKIVASCENGFDGIKAINNFKPNIVYLDIHMPKLNGFELLELLAESYQIIFTTAYDEYAVKAFEKNATDYLLKPFSKERFLEATQKAVANIAGSKNQKRQKEMLQGTPLTEYLERVVVKSDKKINVIPVQDIEYIHAQDDYVMIYSSAGKFLKQARMQFYEQHLNKSDFIRIHRSYIVKLNQIDKIEPYGKDSYLALLHNGARINISKSGMKNLKEQLDF